MNYLQQRQQKREVLGLVMLHLSLPLVLAKSDMLPNLGPKVSSPILKSLTEVITGI